MVRYGKNSRGLIIAIDGPSGAGKSTITRLLADRLGYVFLDTGAMYRAVALAAQRKGVAADDDAALEEICRHIRISFARTNGCCRVMLDDEDVSEMIRTPEISLLTSLVSTRKVVREFMLRLQREMAAREGGVILEGRDIGTVVFPDADVKFFLSASAEERGKRRYNELKAAGKAVDLGTTIAEVMQRDEQDVRREHAPLRRADDAVGIDSTQLAVDEVLERMEKVVRERLRS